MEKIKLRTDKEMKKLVAVIGYKNEKTGEAGEDTLILNVNDFMFSDDDKTYKRLAEVVNVLCKMKGFTFGQIYTYFVCDEKDIPQTLENVKAEIKYLYELAQSSDFKPTYSNSYFPPFPNGKYNGYV